MAPYTCYQFYAPRGQETPGGTQSLPTKFRFKGFPVMVDRYGPYLCVDGVCRVYGGDWIVYDNRNEKWSGLQRAKFEQEFRRKR